MEWWKVLGQGIAGSPQMVMVDRDKVDLDDLVAALRRPGGIVRVRDLVGLVRFVDIDDFRKVA